MSYRINKLDYINGDNLDERSFQKYTPASRIDVITSMQLQVDYVSLELYAYFKISSAYFSMLTNQSEGAGMLVKFDKDLNILWWKRIEVTIKTDQ